MLLYLILILIIILLALKAIVSWFGNRVRLFAQINNNFKIFVLIVVVIFFVPVIVMLPPRNDSNFIVINGYKYVPYDVFMKNISITHTNHDKKMKEINDELDTCLDEVDKEQGRLQKKFEKKEKKLNQTFMKDNNNLRKEKEQIKFDLIQSNYEKEELKKELKLLKFMMYEDGEVCEYEPDRIGCDLYKDYLAEQKKQEEDKEDKIKFKELIAILSRRVCLVFYISIILLTFVYYEFGFAYRVYIFLAGPRNTKDSNVVIISVLKFRYLLFQTFNYILILVLYAIVYVLFGQETFYSFSIMLLFLGLNFIYIFVIYNCELFIMGYASKLIRGRRYTCKDAQLQHVQMEVMKSAICYKHGYHYDEILDIILSARMNVDNLIKLIDKYGLSDISMIAVRLVERMNARIGNGAVGLNWLQNNENQHIMDGSGDLNTYLNRIDPANLGIDGKMQLLIDINEDFDRRIQQHWSDKRVCTVYLMMLYLIAGMHSVNFNQLDQRYLVNNEEDKIVQMLLHNKRTVHEFYKYDLVCKAFYLCKSFEIAQDVCVFVQSVSRIKSTIQIYNSNLEYLRMKPCKIKGKMKIRSDDPEGLIVRLCHIMDDNEYIICNDDTMVHPDSHYISKVMHMKYINEMVDCNVHKEVLDVGTNFCDVKLGHGVWYNMSLEEEIDSLRIQNYVKRLIDYLRKHESCINILVGDVTQMDLSETRITSLYMHNCVYNIDLARAINMWEYNGLENVVTNTQMARTVFDCVECENKTNQMTYSFELSNNQSTFSNSNFDVIGITEGGTYVHQGSKLFDWFKINSVDIGMDKFWNKSIDNIKLGYYKQTWYCSSQKKGKEERVQDNEDTMDCVVCESGKRALNITFTSRSKEANIRDLNFVGKYDINTRDKRVTSFIRNNAARIAKFETIECFSFRDIATYGFKDNCIYYRLIRPSIDQKQLKLDLGHNIQIRSMFEYQYVKSVKIDVQELVQHIKRNEYDDFCQIADVCYENGLEIFCYVEGFNDVHLYRLDYGRKLNYSKTIVLQVKEGELTIIDGSEFDLLRAICLTKIAFYQNMCARVFGLLKQEMPPEYYHHKNVENIVNEIHQGRIHDEIRLESVREYFSNTKTFRRDRNGEVETEESDQVKSKEYVIPKDVGIIPTPFIDECKETGVLKCNFVTSLAVLDLDSSTYYDPFGVLDYNNAASTFALKNYNQAGVTAPRYLRYRGQNRYGRPAMFYHQAYVDNNDTGQGTIDIQANMMQNVKIIVILGGRRYVCDSNILSVTKFEGMQINDNLKNLVM